METAILSWSKSRLHPRLSEAQIRLGHEALECRLGIKKGLPQSDGREKVETREDLNPKDNRQLPYFHCSSQVLLKS